jgi:protein-tyrosine phosphatase
MSEPGEPKMLDSYATGRVHRISGISNLRDTGGYVTAQGRFLRRGRLLRSAHPDALDLFGAEQLASLAVATIVDLRGVSEARALQKSQSGLAAVKQVKCPVEPSTMPFMVALAEQGKATRAALHDVMIESYRRYVAQRTEAFAPAFHAVIDHLERPVMVHCAAGKDRTGFLMAMLLSALEVPRETIIEDYLLTNEAWHSEDAPPPGVPEEAYLSMRVAHADYLDAAFDEIDARYGNLAAYLRNGFGLDDGKRLRLLELMAEDRT